jgi:NAD(P)-dependent dehydrogenase (short-subunit alcohol dehydrogenase family)
MGYLDQRVAIVTGAGRGIGREHALLLAAEGARVVVNDLGTQVDGSGADRGPAQAVVDEIAAAGGTAVANTDDVADEEGASHVVETAIETFGDLHVLVNNAGILRDHMFVSMTTDDWDAVMEVHLRGHFCPTRRAVDHWRSQSKSGKPVQASIVNTTSVSGLFGNPGQSNYGAAKAGIAAMTLILADELARYGIRCNALAPSARTRMSDGIDLVRAPEGQGEFDTYHPANNSPLVAALAAESCPITGEVFLVVGSDISRLRGWTLATSVSTEGRWDVATLAKALESELSAAS